LLALPAALVLVLVGSVISRPAPVAAEPPAWVQLCQHDNYRGRCETFTTAVKNLSGNFIGDDTASSVRIAPGVTAALYQLHTYYGACTTVMGDIPNLKDSNVGTDAVTSLRIGVSCVNPRPEAGVQLCLYPNYSGPCETLTGSDPDLKDNMIGNDAVSSLRLGPNVAIVALFEHPNYKGRCWEFTADDNDLPLRGGDESGGRASSVRFYSGCVIPGPDVGVRLCEDANYQGRCETFKVSDPDLRDNHILGNTISSLRVAPSTIVALYQDANYQGFCELFVAHDPDLSNNRIRGNTISSVRVGEAC
jgi:hypothetical protein